MSKKLLSLLVSISAIYTSGCSVLAANQQPSQFERNTQSVVTEYSGALVCLGDLVDKTNQPALTVYVRDIKDETVPHRFRDRRLSKGGAWWFHTAINKMQSQNVMSVLEKPNREFRDNNKFMQLSGAWTQDDNEVGVNQKNLGFNNLARGYLDRFGFFSREEVSVIAGDFVSAVDGRVSHASAISLAVNQSDTNYELRIDDGSRRFDFGLTNDVNEGPQFAQRRIAEAAALVHVAAAFNVDYSLCLGDSQTGEQKFLHSVKEYKEAEPEEQTSKMQYALTQAGYYNGEIDGDWGPASIQALQNFQTDNDLIANPDLSAETYAQIVAMQ
ncbi:MAG: peptidoglycan-binding domain-containing protein [Pseudomonadota bacterium]